MNEKRLPPDLPKNPMLHERRRFPEVKLEEVVDLINRNCGPISVEHFGLSEESNDSDVLIFLPTATREFKNMVYWGERHPINIDEQIYQGMGHILMDRDRRIIVISHFLYIYAAKRTPVSACIIGDNIDSIMLRIERERELYAKNEKCCNSKEGGMVYDPIIDIAGESEAVLYGHTHPNLGCFFSPPDRKSGFASPNLPAVTFVADPIRKEMKAGVGRELKDARILVYSYEACSEPRIVSINSFEPEKTIEMKKDKIKGSQFVKADELVSEIGRACNELLNPLYATKGKYFSHTTITGAQKIKMVVTWKPDKKDKKRFAEDSGTAGKNYDS